MAKGISPGKWNENTNTIKPNETTAEWNMKMAKKNKKCYLNSEEDAPNIREKLCHVIKKFTGEANMKRQHACQNLKSVVTPGDTPENNDDNEEEFGDLEELFSI